MKRVILVAPVFSLSGYGTHSRQLARYLLNRKDVELTVAPVQWGNTSWTLDADDQDGLVGELLKRTSTNRAAQPQAFDVSFQVQLPNEWNVTLAKKNIGVTAAVETHICNANWLKCVKEMYKVIVPSNFTRSVLEQTAIHAKATNVELGFSPDYITSKIAVVNESYHDSIADNHTIDLSFQTDFNFLSIGQLTGRLHDTDRKNTFNMLKWFCEEFKNDSNVGLILKTNSGTNTKIDRMLTKDIMNEVLSIVRKGKYPHVYMLHGNMTDEELSGLYRHKSVKAFLSCTHGEGYGLPLLEAATASLPIIATDWSGHLDFLNHGKFVRLDYELNNIPPSRIDKNIFVQGARWANVNELDVKKKLRKFYARSNIPQEWAKELSKKILENFSFDAISKQYDKALEDVL